MEERSLLESNISNKNGEHFYYIMGGLKYHVYHAKHSKYVVVMEIKNV